MPEATTPTEGFRSWGLLELMGRTRLAGELSEQTIGGCAFIRIDVPQVGAIAAHTRYFTQQALYGMTPLEEGTARKLAAYLEAKPVSAYEIREGTQNLLGHTPASPARESDGDSEQEDDGLF